MYVKTISDSAPILESVGYDIYKTMTAEQEQMFFGLRAATDLSHGASIKAGWYTNLATGEPLDRNLGEMLMLIVSEVAEAMEGERKTLMDDKLPHRPMAEVEMADVLIRVFDYAGYRGYDLAGAVVEKMHFNASRQDHQIENRIKEGGKKF